VTSRDFVLNATFLSVLKKYRPGDQIKKENGRVYSTMGRGKVHTGFGRGPKEVGSLGISRCRCIIKMYLRAWKGFIWFSTGSLANAVRNTLLP